MYLGKLCEVAGADDLYDHPAHPYTGVLLNANPEPDPDAPLDLESDQAVEMPSPINPPSGCRFHPRCPLAVDRCRAEAPELRGDTRQVACHEVEP
jgi:oligopeptide/dipeptide ABC transporter ATP-binding protein